MLGKTKLFLKILAAELEDLSQDILMVEARYKIRFEKAEISNYVYLENEALLAQEADALKALIRIIDTQTVYPDEELTDCISRLGKCVSEFLQDGEYPEVVGLFLLRKIEKVKKYIEEACS